MRPVLFRFSLFNTHIEIGSYRFFLILAAVAGVGLAWSIAKRRGLPSRRTLILLLSVAAAVPIGARLLHVATNSNLYLREPARLVSFEASGFALYGGLFAAVGVGAIAAWVLKLNLWRTADSVIPALGISLAVIRIGCFLDGCCRGIASSLPWAVTYPTGSAQELIEQTGALPGLGGALAEIVAKPQATHPIALYELAAALAGVVFAAVLLRRRAADGVAFLSFALWYSVFRLVEHPLRVTGSDFGGPSWFYPALYIAAAVASCVFLTIVTRRLDSAERVFDSSRSAIAAERS